MGEVGFTPEIYAKSYLPSEGVERRRLDGSEDEGEATFEWVREK
jgi:hypothetical protein